MKTQIALTAAKTSIVKRSFPTALAATLFVLLPSHCAPTRLQAAASDIDSVFDNSRFPSRSGPGGAAGQAPQISLEPASQTITPGSPFNLTISIAGPQSSDTTVTVSSSNAGVVRVVLPSLTIGAGTTTARLGLAAGSVGTATITATLPASLGSGSTTANVNVVAPTLTVIPAFQEVVLPTESSFANLTVTTSPAPTVDTGVFFSNSDPSVVTVPDGVLIRAGKTTICLPLRISGIAGSATITVTTFGAVNKLATVVVSPNSDAPAISLSPDPLRISAGAQGTLIVTIGKVQVASTTVILASCNPSVASAPASVVIPAGATRATFQVKGAATGLVNITATTTKLQKPGLGLGGRTAMTNVVVR